MGTLILDSKGTTVDISAAVSSWVDNPEFALAPEDFRSVPGRIVSSVVLHTTQGIWRPEAAPGDVGPGGRGAENNARYWRREKRSAGAVLLIDSDGSVVQTHYLIPVVAWHAREASMRSIGVEFVQESTGRVYACQWRTCAEIVRAVIASNHAQVRIQNPDGSIQVRTNYDTHEALRRKVTPDTRGIFGHRDVRPEDRGRGDPGDFVMNGIANQLETLALRVIRT